MNVINTISKNVLCSLQTVILASNPPKGGQVLSHCRSAWERRQNLSSVANILDGFFKGKWIESLTLREFLLQGSQSRNSFLL